jgi:hypothetical protein
MNELMRILIFVAMTLLILYARGKEIEHGDDWSLKCWAFRLLWNVPLFYLIDRSF